MPGHMTSTLKGRGMDECTSVLAVFPALLQFRIPLLGSGATRSGLGPLSSLNVSKVTPHRHAYRSA